MNYRKLALALSLCSFLYFFPQNIFSDDVEQANRYYEKYDYKYALELYEKIMAKKPSLEVAQKIANCYRFINDTKNSEKAYARVLTFKGFDPVNYKYYADALKQNSKFEAAKEAYQLYGERVPSKAALATKLANATDAARIWVENPDKSVRMENMQNLNSEYSDFCPVLVGQNLSFVSDRWFTSDPNAKRKDVVYGWTGNPYLKLYLTDREGKAQKISAMPKPINTLYHNGPGVFTASGDTIYFTRIDLPASRKREDINIVKKGIFRSVKQKDGWSIPVRLLGNGNSYSVQHPALSPDGNILYFASDMPGGLGGMDIYASRKNPSGDWDTPKNCGPNINTEEDDVFPYVRKDGKFFYSTKGNIGIGGLDIFMADGSFDIFTVAENLKSPLNSAKDDFGITYADSTNGFLSSNREGGKGLDDIYRFRIIPEVAPKTIQQPIFAVDGQVLEKGTGLPIESVKIILTNKTTGVETSAMSDSRGTFHFELEPEMDYVVTGDKSKYYLQQEGQISTKGLKESTIFTINFELERSNDAYLVRLNNIYYNFDKWDIRKDAIPELTKVVNFMNSMPNVNIQLRSHTDSRGPAVYNQYLSQKRAESAINYLKNKGVASQRLEAVGLGESELLNRCKDGVKCSKQEHQMNRRTEFKIVKVEPVLSMASARTLASAKK
ncbi:MAG: OmpA family protein [Sphingobacteriaceae bacterium]|jgi:outer membrane protein OmpA-like peptidoglycan-associated protein|nr:OmpA family protein [Sphingobacteriaceae bacterium]